MTDNRVNTSPKHVLRHHAGMTLAAPNVTVLIDRKAVSHSANALDVTLQPTIRRHQGRSAKLEQSVHKALLLADARLIVLVLLIKAHRVSAKHVSLANAGRAVLDALRHTNLTRPQEGLQLSKGLILDIRPLLKALRPRLITECPARNGLLNRARLLFTTGLNGAASGISISVVSISSKILAKIARRLAVCAKALCGKSRILRAFHAVKLRIKAAGLTVINRVLKPLAVKVGGVVALQARKTLGVQPLAKRIIHAAKLLACRIQRTTVHRR